LSVCTKKGSRSKLTMLELVLAWTDLSRLWQDRRTLEAHQREHHNCIEVLEALGCMPGLEPVALEIVCDEKGLDVNVIQDEKKLAKLKDALSAWTTSGTASLIWKCTIPPSSKRTPCPNPTMR